MSCAVCLRRLAVCAGCGEALAEGGVGRWRMARHATGHWSWREHDHFHVHCAPAETIDGPPGPAAPRAATPQRPHRRAPVAEGASARDRCDLCGESMPVADLAYSTMQPLRPGGRPREDATCLIGHADCLARESARRLHG